MLTKGAIGNLINRYKAVLKKCNLINTFGSLAVASMLVMGGAGVAEAGYFEGKGQEYTVDENTTVPKVPGLGDRVVGGWSITASTDAATRAQAQQEINSKVTVSNVILEPNTGGKNSIVFGNHYISGLGTRDWTEIKKEDALLFKTGTSSVTITNSQVEYVIAGTGMYDSNVRFEGEGTNLTINSGTFGLEHADTNVPEQIIVGGDFLKQGHTGGGGVATGYATSTLKNTNVTIHDGTFNSAVMGGSAVIEYYRASKGIMSAEVTDTATLNINGGTFNGVIAGGGLTSGGGDSESSKDHVKDKYQGVISRVNKADITIDGSSGTPLTVKADIYAGGIRKFNTDSGLPKWNINTVGSADILVKKADVNNIYGMNAEMKLVDDGTTYGKWEFSTIREEFYIDDDNVKTALTLEDASAVTVVLPHAESTLTSKGTSSITTLTGAPTIDVQSGSLTVTNGVKDVASITLGNSASLVADMTYTTSGKKAITGGDNSAIKGRINVGTDAELEVTGKVVFDGIKCADSKSVIYNAGTLNVTGATFSNNEDRVENNTYGGAIRNDSATAKFVDTYFSGNKAIANKNNTNNPNGSGGAIRSDGGSTEVTGGEFDNNYATKMGGAIHVEGYGGLTLKNVIFKNNKAGGAGGAVSSNGGILELENVTFENNYAKGDSGALHYGGSGTFSITDSKFYNNKSSSTGGAIHNFATATIEFEGNNEFSGNIAEMKYTINTDNSASTGVVTDIYNDGSFIISGGKPNDIYNAGKIFVKDGGTISLDGGYTGSGTLVFENGSTLEVADASKFAETGTAAVSPLLDGAQKSGSLVVQEKAKLKLNNVAVNTYRIADNFAGIYSNYTVDPASNAVQLADDDKVASDTALAGWNGENLTGFIEDTSILLEAETRVDAEGDGIIVEVTKAELPEEPEQPGTGEDTQPEQPDTPEQPGTGEDVQPEQPDTPEQPGTGEDTQPEQPGTPEQPSLVTPGDVEQLLPGVIPARAMAEVLNTGVDTHSDDMGRRFLSRAQDSDYLPGGTEAAPAAYARMARAALAPSAPANEAALRATSAKLVNEVSRAAVTAGVQNTSLRIADAASNTVLSHMSLSQHDGSSAIHADGVDFWVAPMYGNLYTSGMVTSGSSVRGQFGGLALGADLEAGQFLGGKFRLGAAINGGGGQSETKGDITSTQNDYDFGGLNFYAGWNRGAFNLIASVGYAFGNHEVEMGLPSSMDMGTAKSDIDTSAFTADLRAEYQLKTPYVDILPHAGVRYTALKTDAHDFSVPGGVMTRTESDTQHIVQFPVGVTLSKDFDLSGWTVKPMADVSVIPAAGDKKAETTVRFTGVDAVDGVNTRVMDSTSWAGTVGVQAEKGSMTFGLNYGVQASSNETDQSIQVKFGWKF
ncbi:autotransporter domain-containing protein [Mailhella sp.]